MSNPLKKSKKVRLSYYLSEAILSDVKDNMNRNGYDLKGKSKWVSEAVASLLSLEGYSELVNINQQMQGFEKLDSLLIDRTMKENLDSAVIEVRRNFPGLEGVQSKIVRTAIMQRLLRQ